MPRIDVRDEFGVQQDHHAFNAGVSFADAAMTHWPDGFPGASVMVLNETGKLATAAEAIVPVDGDVTWTIILRPQGPGFILGLGALTSVGFAEGVAAFAASQWFMVALTAVSLIGSYLLMPKLPGYGEEYNWDEDRPQFFSGQSNNLRPGARVPDVFGLVRVWPQLLVEPVIEYDGANQKIREMYVVSNGKATISQPRIHEEEVGTIPDSAVGTTLFPGDAWPADFPIMQTNSYVSSIALLAPNDRAGIGEEFTFDTGGTIASDGAGFFDGLAVDNHIIITGTTEAANYQLYRVTAASGGTDTISVSPSPGANEVTATGVSDVRLANNVGTFAGGASRKYTLTWTPYYWPEDDAYVLAGYYSNSQVDPGFIAGTLVDTTTPGLELDVAYGDLDVYDQFGDLVPVAGRFSYNSPNLTAIAEAWYVEWNNSGYLPDTVTTDLNVPGTCDEIWFDVEFPQGLYQQFAGNPPSARTIEIRMYHRLVGGSYNTGTVFEYTAISRTTRRFTSKLSVPEGQYEVKFERVTEHELNTTSEVYQDTTSLIAVRGRQVTPDLFTSPLTATMVPLTLSTQDAGQAFSTRSFNVVAQRHLPANGTGTLGPTRRAVDAIMYTAYQQAGYDQADTDFVSELNAINTDLEAIQAASSYFDGIVDQTMTADDQMSLLGAPGRIILYRRAGALHANRLKAEQPPVSLYNSRNKTAPEQRTISLVDANEPDAIIVRYMEAGDDYKEATFQYPPNDVGFTSVNPSEQTLLGVTNAGVAERVAQYQYDKGKYDRDTLIMDATDEAILLAPGDIIAVTDHLEESLPLDGEIINRFGTLCTFDRVVPAGTYWFTMRTRQGTLGLRQQVVFAATGMDQDIPGSDGLISPTSDADTVGLLYSLVPTADAEQDADLFYVTEVSPQKDGPVTVSAIAYSDATYAADTP